jgi:selenocysteine lyase/cysteine desulfurase
MHNAMNYIDQHLDAIRAEFKMLDHWVYLNAGDQMVPGRYWLDAARDFYSFQEFGRMEDIPHADVATHPFLMSAWNECITRGARLINADPDEVTNMYRPAVTANLILYSMFDWNAGDNVVITDLSYPSIPYILQDIAATGSNCAWCAMSRAKSPWKRCSGPSTAARGWSPWTVPRRSRASRST